VLSLFPALSALRGVSTGPPPTRSCCAPALRLMQLAAEDIAPKVT